MTEIQEQKDYKVLARKYRPQTFKDLIGQETLVQTLTNAITKNRIAHAYLLTGVRGIGKTTTARLIAMSLNCERRTKDTCEPCGNCSSCISTREDRCLDVIEIDAASKTGVDDIREIIDNIKYKPVDNHYKIFIIDEVHMLSKNAFNALLKTLEEPPSHIKFIFATTEVKKIPITIISRCQRFDLHRIDKENLINHLKLISKKEEIEINTEAIVLIARYADGSVRDALSLLDQAISNETNKISEETIVKMLGIADRVDIFELMDAIFNGNVGEALKKFKNIYESGTDVLMIFNEMLNVTHFITQIKIVPELKDDIHIPELERKKGEEIANKISMNSLGLIWQILHKGQSELQSGFQQFQHGEMIIIRLIYLYNGPSPDDLLKKDQINQDENVNVKTDISNSNIEESEKPTLNLETSSHLNKVDEKKANNENLNNYISIKSFRQFVDLFYQKREGMIHTYLYNNVKLVSFKEGEVVINAKIIENPHFTRTIAKLISKWTGRIWQVSLSSSNIGKSLYEEDLIEQQNEIDKMKTDKEVQSILKKFPGVTIHSISSINQTTEEKSTLDEVTNTKEK